MRVLLRYQNAASEKGTVKVPKLAVPLTEEKVFNLAPRPKPYKISDGQGLYLFVETTGKKRWRMIYKRLGKGTTLSLGTYPDVSLSAARQGCADARRLLDEGIDPVASKRGHQEQERAARLALPKTPKLRFSMTESGMTIETTFTRLSLTPAQVAALRAFLIASEDEKQNQ